jgi:outer membrane protein OmpA-like peptidoglycan-associated protein
MRRILLAVVTAILSLGFASAAQADGPWTGPYLGIQGGYGFGDSTGGLRVGGFAIPYDIKPSGPLAGVHLGYDYQWGHFIIGGVADADGADIEGSDTTTAAAFRTKLRNDFDASIRAKAGLAFGRFMVYGTGGAAFGWVKTEYSCPTCFHAPGNFDTSSGFRVGWTAGAGAEFMINPKWSAAVEYRYTDLGSQGFSDGVTGASDSGSHFAYNAVTLGVSYHFMPPRAPAAEAPPIVPAMAPVPVPPAPRHAFIVFFDFDRAELTKEGKLVVEQAARSYHRNGFARIEINGYTDLAGTQQYNMRLSQRRATAVAEYLSHLGVPHRVMDVMWHGKANPRVPTPDGVRNPQNRRVEITAP